MNPGTYYAAGGGIIPYLGDSTLFVDVASDALLVLDPNGHIARVAAMVPQTVPLRDDAITLTASIPCLPGIDGNGRLVYGRLSSPGKGQGAMPFTATLPLFSASLTTGRIDTATFLTVAAGKDTLMLNEAAEAEPHPPQALRALISRVVTSPIPFADGCTVMQDGSIAIVRAQDYHVDRIGPDGTVRRLPEIPHTAERLNDSAKAALIDSVVRWREAQARLIAPAVWHYPPLPAPKDLPDYRPPFMETHDFISAVHGDLEGNLWIMTREASDGNEYDVVSPNGLLIDRVKLGAGLAIVAFGPGVVYATSHEAWGTAITRLRLRAR